MFYSDQARLVHYEGGVKARQGDDHIQGSVVDVYLMEETNEVDHINAEGNVVLTQPGRRGVGDKLAYTGSDGRAVLSGKTARVDDAEKGSTMGSQLTFYSRDDRVFVENQQGTGRVKSSHRLNVVGLNVGKWLNNVGAIAGWIPAALLIALGAVAWSRFGSATPIDARTRSCRARSLKDVIFWSTIAFAFGGVESGSTMGEEIEDARRTVPRAILTAGAVITVLYIAGDARACCWRCRRSRSRGCRASCRRCRR